MRKVFLFFFLIPFAALAQETEKELIAREYMSNQEYEKASILYDEIYNKNNSTYIYDNYIECLIKTENWKTAEKIIQKQKKTYNSVARFKVDEGYILQLQEKNKQADKSFNEAIAWALNSQQQTIDLAISFQNRRLGAWAIKTIIEGKKKFPNSGDIIQQLAKIYYDNAKYNEMIDEYLQLLNTKSYSIADIQKELQSYIIEDTDGRVSQAFNDKLVEKIQKQPTNTDYNTLLIWFYEQNGQFYRAYIQAKAFDKRTKTDGYFTFCVAQTCISNKEYAIAKEALIYITSIGEDKEYYADAKYLLYEVEYLNLISTPKSTREEFFELAKNIENSLKNTQNKKNKYQLLNRLANIEAYYLNEVDKAIECLDKMFLINGINDIEFAETKLLKGDIMLLKNEVWEASLLYSQVEKANKNDTIGSYAKFRNARLYYYLGEFDYAAAQLEILRGSTSKLIANDAMELYLKIQENIDEDSSYIPLRKFAKAELMDFCLKYDQALNVLDSVLNNFPDHPILDDALLKRAQIFIKQKKYKQAIEELNVIISTYYFDILADNALLMLGNIYEYYYFDKEKAMKYYLQIITDFPSSILANEARIRYRTLRGDLIN